MSTKQTLKILSIPAGTSEMELPPNCSIVGVVPDYDDDNGGNVMKVFLVHTAPPATRTPRKKAAPKNESS